MCLPSFPLKQLIRLRLKRYDTNPGPGKELLQKILLEATGNIEMWTLV